MLPQVAPVKAELEAGNWWPGHQTGRVFSWWDPFGYVHDGWWRWNWGRMNRFSCMGLSVKSHSGHATTIQQSSFQGAVPVPLCKAMDHVAATDRNPLCTTRDLWDPACAKWAHPNSPGMQTMQEGYQALHFDWAWAVWLMPLHNSTVSSDNIDYTSLLDNCRINHWLQALFEADWL